MCYSAQVLQDLKTYLRQTNAIADLAQIEETYRRRLTDKAVRIPRGFERNFDGPRSLDERRIRELVDQHRAATIPKLEQDIFTQRKRLADAERTLKTKQTKKALEDQRIATSKIEIAIEKLSLLNGTQRHPDDDRIFPMTYAPIVIRHEGRNIVRLARYHCQQAGKPPSIDRQFPGLYNARRDNVEKFWQREFGHTHAVMLVESFFENVQRDGSNVVLHFTPRPAQLMTVACLYSEWRDPKGGELFSFAAITDEPPAEIAAAGHDRCIIPIRPEKVDRWLTPEGRSIGELQAILSDREQPHYEHQVEAA